MIKYYDLIGYIQLNKQFNTSFTYSISASPIITNDYQFEYAIVYGSKLRYSSKVTTNPYWSICLNSPINIKFYKFQEPDYGVSEESTHQKTWIFFGLKESSSEWIAIDSQYNMDNHNSANYIGKYPVNNSGPFLCFKFQTIESFGPNPLLTFRNFDIFERKSYFPQCLKTPYHFQYHLTLFSMTNIIITFLSIS